MKNLSRLKLTKLHNRANAFMTGLFGRAVIAALLGLTGNLATAAVAGSAMGGAAVTDVGSAGYSVPIEIPPGTAGTLPHLSFEYSSATGNGALGMGWSLAGTSSISRCARTIAQDGTRGTVDLSSNDRFCLDGKRLQPISGAVYYPSSGGYRTEIESFSRIVANGTAGAGPASFTVTHRDGTRLDYGNTPDSSYVLPGQSAPFLWALSRVTDTKGNYYTFTYTNDPATGQLNISQIDYTGNSVAPAVVPYNRVVFSYDTTRTDVEVGYVLGAKYRKTARLTSVKAYAGAVLVYDYRIGYDNSPSTGRSRITSLTKCDGQNNCLNPAAFQYQNDTLNLNGSVVSFPAVDATKEVWTSWADINGDGIKDFCRMQGTGTGYLLPSGLYPPYEVRCTLMSASGPTTDIVVASNVSYPQISDGLFFKNDVFLATPDINGDGLADICIGNNCYLSQGNGFSATPIVLPGYNPIPRYNWFVDLSGSGRSDFCWNDQLTSPDGGNVYCSQFNGTSYGPAVLVGNVPELPISAPCDSNSVDLPYCPSNFAHWVDISGDGIPSLCVRDVPVIVRPFNGTPVTKQGRYHCRKWTGTSLGADVVTPIVDLGWEVTQAWVDFNGDGKADFCRVDEYGSNRCMLSTGIGFDSQEVATPPVNATGVVIMPSPNAIQVSMKPLWIDADGDGRADTCSTGGCTMSLSESFAPTNTMVPTNIVVNIPEFILDIDGDGLADYCWWEGPRSAAIRKCTFSNTTNRPDLLRTVTSELGAISTFNYRPITDPAIHTRSSGATYPLVDLVVPVNVVSTMSSSDGIGGTSATSFRYAGARSDNLGRGFLGFQTVRSTLPSGLVKQRQFSQTFPYTGAISTETLLQSDGTTVIQQADTAYANATTGPVGYNSYFVYPTSNVSKSFELDGTFVGWREAWYSSYDTTYGNLLTSYSVTKGANGTLDGYRQDTTTTYVNDATNWILGLPDSVATKSTKPDGTNQTRTVAKSYFADGLLKQEVVEPTNGGLAGVTNLRLQTDFTYDRFGNLATKTVTGADITARTEISNTWDSNGQFLMSSTNALGHPESRTYDARFGSVATLTGPNNLVTTWTYDGFGRVATELRADGTKTTRTYTDCRGCMGNALSSYYVTSADTVNSSGATISAPRTTIFDQLGRVWRSSTTGFDGATTLVTQQFGYDSLGRVADAYAPYYLNVDVPRVVHSTFDVLGRVKTLTKPGAFTTTFVYSGLTATQTNAKSQVTQKTKNSQGQLISVVNAQGSIDQSTSTYAYDWWGNLSKVTDSLGNVVSTTYDLRGRKTALSDPDMGNWTYAYNSLGELVTQTDAKNQATTLTYDKLGRLTKRVEVGLTSNWYYEQNLLGVACTTGVGKICQTKSDNGYSRQYAYDSLGRTSSISEVIDQPTTPYVSTWTYDNAGRLDTVTYPNTGTAASPKNLKLHYNYNTAGYLQSITNFQTGAVIYQRNSLNADGNTLGETFGNGSSQRSVYEPATGRLTSTAVYGPGSSVPSLGSFSYQYDSLANVTNRNDVNNGVNENYDYDALNRLKTASVLRSGQTVADVTSVTYNAIGNITSKNTVGPSVQALSVTLSAPSLTVTSSTSGVQAQGSITATPSGGVSPYTYSWTSVSGSGVTMSNANTATATFSASPTTNQVIQQTFKVTVTDGQSATVSSSNVVVTFNGPPPALAVSLNKTSITMTSTSSGAPLSGTVTATASGGVTPYTYSWTSVSGNGVTVTNANTATATFSAPPTTNQVIQQTFKVTVTDSQNTTVSGSNVVVTFNGPPPALAVNLNTTSITATSTSSGAPLSGTVTATASGGVAPYTYTWNTVSGSGVAVTGGTTASPTFSASPTTSQVITQTFNVTVKDSQNTTVTSSNVAVTFNGPLPSPLAVSLTSTSITATSTSSGAPLSGTVTATPSGGVAPYTYTWNTVSGSGVTVTGGTTASPTFSASPTTSQVITQTFNVTVKDSQNTTVSSSNVVVTFIGPPPPLGVTVSPASPVSRNYAGPGTYSFTLASTASGGSAPYSYSWTDLYGSGYNLINANSATVTVSFSILACDNKSGTVRLTLTDSGGRTLTSDVVLNILSKNNGKLCP